MSRPPRGGFFDFFRSRTTGNPAGLASAGRSAWERVSFRNPESRAPAYTDWLRATRNGAILWSRMGTGRNLYWDDALYAHVRRHLRGFQFRTRFVTVVQMEINPIIGDMVPVLNERGAPQVTEVEQPLLQRDRLMEIFEACPPGSYGFYAARGLEPVWRVVGSFAGATIDRFFAAIVPLLKQPYDDVLNDIASSLETRYWDTREDFLAWLAGLGWYSSRGKRLREWVLSREFRKALASGESPPESTLRPEERLTPEQARELEQALLPHVGRVDEVALAELSEQAYQLALQKGRIRNSTASKEQELK